MRQLLLSIGCAALVAGASCSSSNEQSDEWVIAWEDNFDGNALDSSKWSKIPRGGVDWNNCMSDEDTLYKVENGNLILRGMSTFAEANDSVPYITGGVYTRGKVGFENGRLEIRAKLHAARGAWPAFWLMPMQRTESDWPGCGEIDIMERLNGDSIAYQTVHSDYTVKHGITDNPKSGVRGKINPDDYNVYAVELYPDSLRFFINDSLTNTYPRIETDIPGQFPFDKEWYLMLDMQLGGSWVGDVDPADLPVQMEIDWVKFYKKGEKQKIQ